MRTVGQVLLALVLVGSMLAGGVLVASATGQATDVDSVRTVADAGPAPATSDPALSDRNIDSRDVLGVTAWNGHGRSSMAPSLRGPVRSQAAVETETAATAGSGTTVLRTSQLDAGIVVSQEFSRLENRSGHVRVTNDVRLPDRVVSFRTTVPRRGVVTETTGFAASNETIYEWDGGTEDPSITYTLPVNETGSRSHAATNGSLLFADVGEWALFSRPATSSWWEYRGTDPLAYERRTVTRGPGAAGEWLVYLGAVELHPRTVEGQTFRLAVPAAADLHETPDEILDAMERASGELTVGDRDATVFAVAAPTEGVPWSVKGLSTGDADFWVGADEGLATPENLWIHEYVHTRQAYRTTPETRWTKEGFASYYAAYHALKYDSVSFEAFADALALPANGTNVTLATPATWRNRSDYERGALLAGQIDRRVRLASERERSLDAVFAGMNGASGRLTQSAFLAEIGTAGNATVRETIETSVSTNRSVEMWNRSQHARAFGQSPARFRYGLPEGNASDGYSVAGPYRNDTLAGTDSLTVVTGERLTVNARVTNDGGATGYFEVSLLVNGTVVETASGQIPGDGWRSVPLNHNFSAPGRYTLRVGNDTKTVTAVRPNNASVVGIQMTSGSVQQWGTATLNVTVRNYSPIPGKRTVQIRRGSGTVITRTIYVPANDTTTAGTEISFPTAGTTSIRVSDIGSIDVDVQPRARPTPKPTPNGATDHSVNGTETDDATGVTGAIPGSIAALFALVAVAVLVRYRH